jgi:hypothetical protein
MTDDERTLLVEVAKYCYATGMNKLISCRPLAAAINKFEPDFELHIADKTVQGAKSLIDASPEHIQRQHQ